MENISVIVKPHHLRNNSYGHKRDRCCPLQEALVEAGYKSAIVGVALVRIEDSLFDIPSTWNHTSVEEHIRKANEESEATITLLLTRSKVFN